MNDFRVIHKEKRPTGKRFKKLAVFDVECWKDASRFAFGVVVYSNDLETINTKVFYSVQELKDFLIGNELKGYHIFAHNGSKYDYISVFGNYILDNTIALMSGAQLIKWKENKRVFYDSYLLLRSGVGKIGEALGLEKGETPQKFIDGNESEGINDNDIEYCKRDCEIVLKALIEIVKNFNYFKPTIASLSFNEFRISLEKPVYVRKKFDNEFTKTYRGGRTECFYIGEYKNAYYYDVNSMYPYVMSSKTFPNPEEFKKINFDTNDVNLDLLDEYEGMVYIKGYSKNKRVGALPVYLNDRLCFPYGKIEGIFNLNEVRTAFNLGLLDISYLGWGILTNPIRPPFADLILEQYKKRVEFKKQGNEFMSLFMKFILNSLYGKFGQKNRQTTYYFSSFENALKYVEENNLDIPIQKINDYYMLSLKPESPFYDKSVYCWASYVTSWARSLLLEYMSIVGFENILYCDTDSLITTKPFPDIYVSDYELGKLKLEGIGDFVGIKSKFYKFDNKIKLKGGSIKNLNVKGDLFDIEGNLLSIDDLESYAVFENKVQRLVTPKTSLRNKKMSKRLGYFEIMLKYFDLMDTKRKIIKMNDFSEAIYTE